MSKAVMEAEYVVVPASGDGNRGDQALILETKSAAEDAGYYGLYSVLSSTPDSNNEPISANIRYLLPLLAHPSAVAEVDANLAYGWQLKAKWGIAALKQAARSTLFLSRLVRKRLRHLATEQELKTLEAFERAEAIFVKGGGFLHAGASVIDDYKFYYYLYHVILALSLKKKVFVMPNSFGPFTTKFQRLLLRAVLQRVDLVSARESRSQRMLKEIGVESELVPDLGFFLDPASPDLVSDLVQHKIGVPTRPLVGITIRPYRFPGAASPEEAYERFLSEITSFVIWLDESGYHPVFIEHVLSAKEHESDRLAIQDVISRLGKADYSVILTPSLSPSEVKTVYSFCDYVVGTRFHSVIFAISSGIPAMAISYGGNKGRGIMEDLGLDEYVLGIEEFRAENAKEVFRQMVADSAYPVKMQEISARVMEGRSKLLKLLTRNAPQSDIDQVKSENLTPVV